MGFNSVSCLCVMLLPKMVSLTRQSSEKYDTSLGPSTHKLDFLTGFSVWVLFDKNLVLLKITNPGQCREDTSSAVKS